MGGDVKDRALDVLATALLWLPRVVVGVFALLVLSMLGGWSFALFPWWPGGIVGFLLGGLAFAGVIVAAFTVVAVLIAAHDWASARRRSHRAGRPEAGTEGAPT